MSKTFRACLAMLLGACAALSASAQTTAVQTHTALSVSTRAAAAGRTETVFTAHVTGVDGEAATADAGSATVSFETASGSLGSATVDENGDASIAVGSLPAGAQTAVRAIYHPSAETLASASSTALVEADTSGVPTFTLTANPSSLTVKSGQYGTTTLTVTPQNGFSEQVTLSCSNLPAQATCNFSPVIASTANGAFTSTLEVQTQAPSGAVTPPDFGRGSHIAFAWLLPGVLALAGFAAARRRALTRSVAVVLLAAGIVALSGCNSRYYYEHHPPQVATGTLAGTYTVNIAASGNNGSSVTTQNISLTLTVQ
jgi:hypothetical protein